MLGEKKLTVDLGDQKDTLDERMATGRYGSPSEVVQEALQALEREDALLEEIIAEKLDGVMDEPEASRPNATEPEASRLDATEPAGGRAGG